MTYSELQKHRPFNWTRALFWAPLTSLSEKGHEELTNKAKRWTTCACGNQCSILPRWPDGEPKDARLSDLGFAFHTHIRDKEWKEAHIALNAIERRSGYLINAMLA